MVVEMQLKKNIVSGMKSKTNNTASTLVIPTQNVYKGIYHCEDVYRLSYPVNCDDATEYGPTLINQKTRNIGASTKVMGRKGFRNCKNFATYC
jgi:hypothetical protein